MRRSIEKVPTGLLSRACPSEPGERNARVCRAPRDYTRGGYSSAREIAEMAGWLAILSFPLWMEWMLRALGAAFKALGVI